jgi:MFS family permease
VQILFFMNGALFATWASRIPAVQAQHSLGNGALGFALLALALGAVIAMPLAGMLMARMGSAKLCKISAVLYCCALPAVVSVPHVYLFVIALFCFGASHGAMDVAMNAQAVAVEQKFARPIMSSFHALWSTGGLVGAAIGGLLTSRGLTPFAHVGLMAGLLGVVSILAFPHLLEVGQPSSDAARHEVPAPTFALPTRGIFALGALALCVMVGEGAMADWSAVYLRNNIGTTESLATVGFATFSIAMAAGRFWGDILIARIGPVKLTRIGGTLAASGLLLALASGDALVALVGFACVGAGFSTVVPMVFTAAGNTPGVSPGVALASVTTLGYLGFLIAPPVIGVAAKFIGLRPALGIIVATSLVIVALAPVLTRRVQHPA